MPQIQNRLLQSSPLCLFKGLISLNLFNQVVVVFFLTTNKRSLTTFTLYYDYIYLKITIGTSFCHFYKY